MGRRKKRVIYRTREKDKKRERKRERHVKNQPVSVQSSWSRTKALQISKPTFHFTRAESADVKMLFLTMWLFSHSLWLSGLKQTFISSLRPTGLFLDCIIRVWPVVCNLCDYQEINNYKKHLLLSAAYRIHGKKNTSFSVKTT